MTRRHVSSGGPWEATAGYSRAVAVGDSCFVSGTTDAAPDVRPNDWCRAFPPGEPAWSWDEATRAWFLHVFAPEQPDLNWDHPDVRPAMLDTLRFWLDRGVDGFRADVAHALGKVPALPDAAPHLAGNPQAVVNEHTS